jgi:hypothetical protein
MLFDLRGRRQRAVKVIYFGLAVLMGGGLVFFGVGGSVSGGLLDAFKGGGGSSNAEEAIQDRIDSAQKRLDANPRSAAALKVLVRENYQLATAQIGAGATGFPSEAVDELQRADTYWQRYLKTEKKTPDASLAALAAQLYGPSALNRPPDAQEAYRIIAERTNDVSSYLQLVSAATTAGDTRTADLAAAKAVDLAPAKARKALEKQIKQIKKDAKKQAAGAQAGG